VAQLRDGRDRGRRDDQECAERRKGIPKLQRPGSLQEAVHEGNLLSRRSSLVEATSDLSASVSRFGASEFAKESSQPRLGRQADDLVRVEFGRPD
jgi:hypothetical protein